MLKKSAKADDEDHYTLNDLMSLVTPENLHERIELGKAVGNEFVGLLNDKSSYVATLEQIESAIQDGWAMGDFNSK